MNPMFRMSVPVIEVPITESGTHGALGGTYDVIAIRADFDVVGDTVVPFVEHTLFDHAPHAFWHVASLPAYRMATVRRMLCTQFHQAPPMGPSSVRKLLPMPDPSTPKNAATVAPRSANVSRSPSGMASFMLRCHTRRGTHSRVWSVPGVVGSQP
ncbi:hypothetical protein ALPO108162_05990 [Alicyclobacillus pomorum]